MKKWQTISTKVVYKGKHVKLQKEKYMLPNGNEGIYDILVKTDFVLVIAKYKGIFYLINLYRYPVKSYSLEFVKGMIDKGESPKDAAKRELEEELGMKAKSLTPLGKLFASSGQLSYSCHIFLAQGLSEGKQGLEEGEEGLQRKILTLNQLKDAITKSKIKDGICVAAFGLYQLKATQQ